MTISAVLLYQIMNLAVGALAIFFGYRLFLAAGGGRPSSRPMESQTDGGKWNLSVPAFILTAFGILIIGISVARGGAEPTVDRTLLGLLDQAAQMRDPDSSRKIWEYLLSKADGKDAALWFQARSEASKANLELKRELEATQEESQKMSKKLETLLSTVTNLLEQLKAQSTTEAKEEKCKDRKGSPQPPIPPVPVPKPGA